MSNDCCANAGQVMLLACSGGSNVGQLSNAAAVELTKEGFGKMFCLAGIGGGLSGFVQSAKDAPAVVVIDGCDIACAKAIFNQAGVPLRGHLVLTALGLAKNKDLDPPAEQVELVKAAIKKAAAGQAPATGDGGACCRGQA